MSDQRIFWATKKVEITDTGEGPDYIRKGNVIAIRCRWEGINAKSDTDTTSSRDDKARRTTERPDVPDA